MAIQRYLAMTAGEFQENRENAAQIGWMACHFSPYGRGLSNLPLDLPAGSLLILDDITPIHGHDPDWIRQQVEAMVETCACSGVLLDFQRPGYEETAALIRTLVSSLPCPVGVSSLYADGLDCPVLVPPVSPSAALEDYLKPWSGREIWLDLALTGEAICLTEAGVSVSPLVQFPSQGQQEPRLRCHYQIQVEEEAARFSLWRTEEDWKELLEDAQALGVTAAIGLWQEFCQREEAFP